MEYNELCDLCNRLKNDIKQSSDYVFELREDNESDTLRSISDYDLIAELEDRGYDVVKHKEDEQ